MSSFLYITMAYPETVLMLLLITYAFKLHILAFHEVLISSLQYLQYKIINSTICEIWMSFQHFVIFIFRKESVCIFIWISLKFVPKGPTMKRWRSSLPMYIMYHLVSTTYSSSLIFFISDSSYSGFSQKCHLTSMDLIIHFLTRPIVVSILSLMKTHGCLKSSCITILTSIPSNTIHYNSIAWQLLH